LTNKEDSIWRLSVSALFVAKALRSDVRVWARRLVGGDDLEAK
jgi:hypothetical protein